MTTDTKASNQGAAVPCTCERVQTIDGGYRLHCPDCGTTYRRNSRPHGRGWEFESRKGNTRIGPDTPDNSMVICPHCTSQFPAISVNDQKRESDLYSQFDSLAEQNRRLAAEREALRQEVDGLRKDAERYRWLRGRFGIQGPQMSGQHPWYYKASGLLRGPSLDAAVDAAIERDSPSAEAAPKCEPAP